MTREGKGLWALRKGALQGRSTEAQAFDRQQILEPFAERGGRTGVLLVQAPRQIREHTFSQFGIFGSERVFQSALHRPSLALRQRVQHVPLLVLLASLDERASSED